MSKQLYYLAIVCPENVNTEILIHKHWMRQHFGCKAALKSPAHITLIPSFLMEEQLGDDLMEILSSFRWEEPRLDLGITNFDHFGSRVIFARVGQNERLTALKASLEEHMVQYPSLGIRQEMRTFHAHVTIANRDLQEADFAAAWAHFEHLTYSARFSAETFSLLQLEGPRWEILRTFEW
jgi:2'-5' RNA ligase